MALLVGQTHDVHQQGKAEADQQPTTPTPTTNTSNPPPLYIDLPLSIQHAHQASHYRYIQQKHKQRRKPKCPDRSWHAGGPFWPSPPSRRRRRVSRRRGRRASEHAPPPSRGPCWRLPSSSPSPPPPPMPPRTPTHGNARSPAAPASTARAAPSPPTPPRRTTGRAETNASTYYVPAAQRRSPLPARGLRDKHQGSTTATTIRYTSATQGIFQYNNVLGSPMFAFSRHNYYVQRNFARRGPQRSSTHHQILKRKQSMVRSILHSIQTLSFTQFHWLVNWQRKLKLQRSVSCGIQHTLVLHSRQ